MKFVIAPVVLAFGLACGGGGGSSTPPAPSPFEGPWIGSMYSTKTGTSVTAVALILANGSVRYVGSNGIQGVGSVTGTAAAFQSSGTIYAPTGYTFVGGGTTSSYALAGTGTSGVSMSGTYTASVDAGTFTFLYDTAADYAQPVVMANVAGTFQSITTTSGYSTQGRLTSAGGFSGSDAFGGSFTGTLTPVDAAKNAFTVAITYSAPGIPATAFNGLAYFDFGGTTMLNIQASAGLNEFAGSFICTGP